MHALSSHPFLLSDPFLWNALCAAVLLACMSGPLGCIAVWKGMARFGETFAHVALFGAVIAILGGMLPGFGMVMVALVLSLLLPLLAERTRLPIDSLLGILAPGSVALALVLAQLTHLTIDFEALLFGELMTTTPTDLATIAGGLAATSVLMIGIWRIVLLDVLSRDLALSEGFPVRLYDILTTAALGLFIALGVRIAGLLLINAFLVVPASCLVILSRRSLPLQNPERMALGAIVVNIVCVLAGFVLAFAAHLPVGASICAVLFIVFCLMSIFVR